MTNIFAQGLLSRPLPKFRLVIWGLDFMHIAVFDDCLDSRFQLITFDTCNWR
jgi:hypothetical protein